MEQLESQKAECEKKIRKRKEALEERKEALAVRRARRKMAVRRLEEDARTLERGLGAQVSQLRAEVLVLEGRVKKALLGEGGVDGSVEVGSALAALPAEGDEGGEEVAKRWTPAIDRLAQDVAELGRRVSDRELDLLPKRADLLERKAKRETALATLEELRRKREEMQGRAAFLRRELGEQEGSSQEGPSSGREDADEDGHEKPSTDQLPAEDAADAGEATSSSGNSLSRRKTALERELAQLSSELEQRRSKFAEAEAAVCSMEEQNALGYQELLRESLQQESRAGTAAGGMGMDEDADEAELRAAAMDLKIESLREKYQAVCAAVEEARKKGSQEATSSSKN